MELFCFYHQKSRDGEFRSLSDRNKYLENRNAKLASELDSIENSVALRESLYKNNVF